MKRELFFLLLIIVGVILYLESSNVPSLESFQDTITVPKPNPQVATLQPGDPSPFSPPSTALLSPPPGQTASVNSYPAHDPAMEKAPLNRIKEVHATLKGFIENEAKGLSEIGDPAVQLPLGSAKADLRRLSDETMVLMQNPGIQSSLTQDDLGQIEANMGYLQQKWRLSVNTMGPIVEGFEYGVPNVAYCSANPSSYDPDTGRPCSSQFPRGSTGPTGPLIPATLSGASGPGVGSSGSTGSRGKTPASLYELQDLVLRIAAEVMRLKASGTTDPIITNRINALNKISASVSDIIRKVGTGQMREQDIPILESDYYAFLPVMANVNSPLPRLISDSCASPALSSLFPLYNSGDISGAALAQSLFSKYAGDFAKNISWDMNIRYTGESDQAIANNLAEALGANSKKNDDSDKEHGYRGMFDSLIKQLSGKDTSTGPVANHGAPGNYGTAANLKPSTLDWKQRSQEICDQLNKRGLKPYDFGCIDIKTVGDNFSFRGYTKMICNRISTMYDPSIPELCGCPPPTWPGWRP